MILPLKHLPLLLAASLVAGPAFGGPPERYKLYTKPDPECPGGITARVTKPADLLWEAYQGEYKRHDFRRTSKLILLKDVGVGWQVERTRDLYPCWVEPKFFLPTHHHTKALSRIRVADSIKDLGEIDLAE